MSTINEAAILRFYLDTQEYSDRLAAIEAQAASSLDTQQTAVAAAIAQVNLAQSQTITALTLEVSNLKTDLTNSITATQTDLINRADQLAQNVTDITVQLTQDKATFTQEIQDALGYLQDEASVASALRTPRKIQGVDFDGTQDISLPTFTAETDGLVPKRVGATADNYLREDGTWVVPTDTTYALLTKASAEDGTATDANTISAQVLKEAIQYHAPTVTNIVGNAETATKLQTPRTINGVSFDGTQDISLPEAVAYSLPTASDSVLGGIKVGSGLAISNSVLSVGTLNQSTTGNAATATKLQTARTISLTGDVTGSVSFDGSSDVSITTTVNGTSGTPGEDGSNVDNSGLIILIKDSLRQSVEVASGGEQTVLYTAKGQPTYMNIIKKFDMSTIDPSLSGTHPAFIVDGVEKPEIFIGTYQGVIKYGELLSLPNVDPTVNTDYDNFLNAARANGNGHHLITNAEWSAVALQCYKNNTQPMGNSYYGRSVENPLLTGRRADGLNPGDVSGSGRTLTGSGPVQWRHTGKSNGIADLSGNVWEWNSGMRTVKGEIQVIAGNNAALHTIDLSATSAQWKAIDGATGDLVMPLGGGTTPGTVKITTTGSTEDYTIQGTPFGGIKTLSTVNPVSAAALSKLKALCLFPHIDAVATFNGDSFERNLVIEAQSIRGGNWLNGITAGVFYLNLRNQRSLAYPYLGSRPAFVNL